MLLLRGAGDTDLELAGDGGSIAALLRLLDGRHTITDLTEALRRQRFSVDESLVAEAVRELDAENLIDDQRAIEAALGPDDVERYARQLACFADMFGGADQALAAQQRLEQATVCLLGLGGLGSWAAWALASAGIGRLIGVDGDVVELSNLNRQILYREADLAASKALSAGAALTSFNSSLVFEPVDRVLDGPEAVAEVVAGADVVLDSLDTPAHDISRWVNAGCQRAGVALIGMSQHPPTLRIGPMYVPGRTGCFACQELRYREDYPLYGALETSEQLAVPSATFGPACAIVGAMVASEVVRWLAGVARPATLGATLLLDMASLTVTREEMDESGCQVCRPGRARLKPLVG